MAKPTTLDASSSRPSARVAERLREEILRGGFGAHDRLPSLRELGRRYGVAVNTVRRGLVELEREGLLYRRERNGTFVHPSFPRTAQVGAAIKCVNVVHTEHEGVPQALNSDARYLVGYTQALESSDAKLRFALWNGGDYALLLSDRFAFHEQGCVLCDIADAAFIDWLRERSVPFVMQACQPYPAEDLSGRHAVFINKTGAIADAARRLIELGHRRIGYIGAFHWRGETTPMLRGLRAALACAGLELPEADTLDVSAESPGEAYRPVRDYVRRAERPTAVVAGNDATAMDVLAAAREAGLRVPEELSVIGYNNSPGSGETDPPLTTIHPPREAAGREAVRILLEDATDEDENWTRRILECELVWRGSAGPARETHGSR